MISKENQGFSTPSFLLTNCKIKIVYKKLLIIAMNALSRKEEVYTQKRVLRNMNTGETIEMEENPQEEILEVYGEEVHQDPYAPATHGTNLIKIQRTQEEILNPMFNEQNPEKIVKMFAKEIFRFCDFEGGKLKIYDLAWNATGKLTPLSRLTAEEFRNMKEEAHGEEWQGVEVAHITPTTKEEHLRKLAIEKMGERTLLYLKGKEGKLHELLVKNSDVDKFKALFQRTPKLSTAPTAKDKQLLISPEEISPEKKLMEVKQETKKEVEKVISYTEKKNMKEEKKREEVKMIPNTPLSRTESMEINSFEEAMREECEEAYQDIKTLSGLSDREVKLFLQKSTSPRKKALLAELVKNARILLLHPEKKKTLFSRMKERFFITMKNLFPGVKKFNFEEEWKSFSRTLTHMTETFAGYMYKAEKP